MHFYSLIVAAICLDKVSSADLHQPFAAFNPLQIEPALAALHAFLTYATAVLETIVPTIATLMPDKAPLLIGACIGCNTLALRILPSRSMGVGEQVSL